MVHKVFVQTKNNFAAKLKRADMEKEKVFQILNELTRGMRPLRLSFEDYSYLADEHEIECFSHASSTNENITRVKEILDKLGEDLLNTGIDFERFVLIIECNSQKELMMMRDLMCLLMHRVGTALEYFFGFVPKLMQQMVTIMSGEKKPVLPR